MAYTYLHLTTVQAALIDNYDPWAKQVKLSELLDEALNNSAGTFVALSDVPSTYVAQAGLSPVVNVGETALEFEARTVPVSPSVVGNIVTFSGITGAQDDSGIAIGAIATAQAAADAALLLFNRVAFAVHATVDVVADATYVGSGFPIIIPAHTVLYGFLIEGAAPGGTAGGAKTIQYSVGTVQNADTDLTDPTDIDIMIATGAVVAAASVHGDQAADHVAAFFPMDMHGTYFPVDTTIYVNYIGQSADATANPGTVTCAITTYALVGRLA